jgi:hypothetical protein
MDMRLAIYITILPPILLRRHIEYGHRSIETEEMAFKGHLFGLSTLPYIRLISSRTVVSNEQKQVSWQ